VCAMSPEQFEARLRECWPHVRGIIRRFAWDADAEDLAQEIALAAWGHRGELRDPGAFEGWVAKIAVNAGRAHFRRRTVAQRCSLHVNVEETTRDPISEIEDRDLLARALAALSDTERHTLRLRAQEFSTREIADRLGEPEGTTRARLSRTRRKLRSRLARYGWTSLGRDTDEKGDEDR